MLNPLNLPSFLKPVTCAEIFKFINSLPLNKASGLDNISVGLLKEAAPIVTSSLTFIISLSILKLFQTNGSMLEFPQFSKRVPKLTLVITDQSQFYLLSVNWLGSCIQTIVGVPKL